jgi:fucokinase
VNVAIDLEGEPPVCATVEAMRGRGIILESRDLGRSIELKRNERGKAIRLDDPFALHKVAIDIAGVRDVGMRVTTECRVPKGSGLGTSSILGATLLAALHGFGGERPARSLLIEQTQLLEQRLSTGGGWQDQVGGIVGGIKFSTSQPGVPQRIRIESLKLSEARLKVFEERLVVYYTGQQRLARDILRRVMGRWLAREPAMVLLMEQLKASARGLRDAMCSGRWGDAPREIERYWRIKKELYPGSTTPAVDELFLETRAHYAAAGLAGAGGGGFAYFFCESSKQAGRLRHELARHAARPGSLGAVYEARINREGLIIKREHVGSASADGLLISSSR